MAGVSSCSAGAGRTEVAPAHGIQGRSKPFTHLNIRAHRCPAIGGLRAEGASSAIANAGAADGGSLADRR